MKAPNPHDDMIGRPAATLIGEDEIVGSVVAASTEVAVINGDLGGQVWIKWGEVIPLCLGCGYPLDETSEDEWPGSCRNNECFL